MPRENRVPVALTTDLARVACHCTRGSKSRVEGERHEAHRTAAGSGHCGTHAGMARLDQHPIGFQSKRLEQTNVYQSAQPARG